MFTACAGFHSVLTEVERPTYLLYQYLCNDSDNHDHGHNCFTIMIAITQKSRYEHNHDFIGDTITNMILITITIRYVTITNMSTISITIRSGSRS